MIRTIVLPLLAVLGIGVAIYTVRAGEQVRAPAPPVTTPPMASYAGQVAGAGLVESASENIAIGTLVPGVVSEMYVQVGQRVKKGEKLFAIDARDLDAQLVVREAGVSAAEQRLAKLRQQPRPEDVPPLEAKVAEMQANLSNAQDELKRLQSIGGEDGSGVSRDELRNAKWSVAAGEAQLAGAQATLAQTKAGAWSADLIIAEADLKSARAEVEALKIEYTRRTVYAPIDGQVIQVKIRVGEYATAGALSTPLMVVGRTDVLHVRADIDENDAWRLKEGATAQASLRGNSQLKVGLTFVRVEPYVIPKRSLTGDSTERVDTRVLQAIYRIDNPTFPIYVGQQMDVFVDASE